MLTFPIQNAASSLQGKLPEELPHGLIRPPAEVRELIERERSGYPPEVFAREEMGILNLWTIAWFFDGLHQEIIYRETAEGPEVVAVGYDEMCHFRSATPPEEQRKFKGYLGY
jgi:hypothetical protein